MYNNDHRSDGIAASEDSSTPLFIHGHDCVRPRNVRQPLASWETVSSDFDRPRKRRHHREVGSMRVTNIRTPPPLLVSIHAHIFQQRHGSHASEHATSARDTCTKRTTTTTTPHLRDNQKELNISPPISTFYTGSTRCAYTPRLRGTYYILISIAQRTQPLPHR